MNLLALDLGSKCGWALSENGRIESGVQDFTPKRGESAGMRYIAFNRWLQEILGAFRDGQDRPCDVIVYEMPHLRGGHAATVLAGLQTRVEEFCARRGIEHQPVHSATLKKFAAGKGNAKKGAVMKSVRMLGWADHVAGTLTDDEADALALLHYALAELIPAK